MLILTFGTCPLWEGLGSLVNKKNYIYMKKKYIYIHTYIHICTEQARGPAKNSPYSLATVCVKPFRHYIVKAYIVALPV